MLLSRLFDMCKAYIRVKRRGFECESRVKDDVVFLFNKGSS
jgi:hypothetical protein